MPGSKYQVVQARAKRNKFKDGIQTIIVVLKPDLVDELKGLASAGQEHHGRDPEVLKKVFKLWKKFKRIRFDTVIECENKQLAYQEAIAMQERYKEKLIPSRIHGDRTADYRVYAFHLDPSVWQDSTFNGLNTSNEAREVPAFYVGQTSKTIEERYAQHIDASSRLSSKWGKKYFLQPFNEAWSDLVQEMMVEYEEQSGVKLQVGLLHSQSILHELRFTEFLRSEGFGAYSA